MPDDDKFLGQKGRKRLPCGLHAVKKIFGMARGAEVRVHELILLPSSSSFSSIGGGGRACPRDAQTDVIRSYDDVPGLHEREDSGELVELVAVGGGGAVPRYAAGAVGPCHDGKCAVGAGAREVGPEDGGGDGDMGPVVFEGVEALEYEA
ncbi:MAG: hypothetical protein LQ341_006212 [Variospora aurantia]|nr:MAG: hypothetical protein LQ341_006212 [Variospora aurantia]